MSEQHSNRETIQTDPLEQIKSKLEKFMSAYASETNPARIATKWSLLETIYPNKDGAFDPEQAIPKTMETIQVLVEADPNCVKLFDPIRVKPGQGLTEEEIEARAAVDIITTAAYFRYDSNIKPGAILTWEKNNKGEVVIMPDMHSSGFTSGIECQPLINLCNSGKHPEITLMGEKHERIVVTGKTKPWAINQKI